MVRLAAQLPFSFTTSNATNTAKRNHNVSMPRCPWRYDATLQCSVTLPATLQQQLQCHAVRNTPSRVRPVSPSRVDCSPEAPPTLILRRTIASRQPPPCMTPPTSPSKELRPAAQRSPQPRSAAVARLWLESTHSAFASKRAPQHVRRKRASQSVRRKEWPNGVFGCTTSFLFYNFQRNQHSQTRPQRLNATLPVTL